MIAYLIRRTALMFPTLLGITLVVFTVMAAAPGGISAQSLIEGQNLEPQAKRAMEAYYNRIYGLDRSAPEQYLRWLNNISPAGFTFDENNELAGFDWAKGSDFGTSFRYGRPVLDLLAERVPITLLLNILSLPLIYAVAIAVGVRAATMRGKAFDTGSGVVMLGLWSVPPMLVGILMIVFFASDQYWPWFPTAGLSEREALDMVFLPHWESLIDVLAVAGSALVGAGVCAFAAYRVHRSLRTIAFALIGGALGFTMGLTPQDPSVLLAGTLGAAGAVTLGVCVATEFSALRVGMGALIGLGIGVGAGFELFAGDFTRGFLFDRLWHLVLPVTCLSYAGFAFLTKLVRTAMLENLQADFARTARAKGVPAADVLWRHVFRNSLLPLITVSASLLPALLGGSVIVESIFSIDGMGKLAVEAVKGRDRELVLSITLISGWLTLAGYLIADLLYAVADPRVSYE
jgi:ABC-type dipeptide/oligopeptide/nickel transport system permease component